LRAIALSSGVLSDEELIALPKADLHVHLVGSAAPHTVVGLAARHPDAGVPADLDRLADFYAFRDFPHFLRVYGAVSALIRTPMDVQTLVQGLGTDLHGQGVGYAEVTVTPYTHALAGIHPAELAQALSIAAREVHAGTGVELAWVYDISGSDGPPGARATLDAALRHPPRDLVGFGLGGPERGVRRADFREAFAAARAAGLHSLPHAGETTGPAEVWAAILDLGAERIGHGIAAVHDPRLLEHLREHHVVLELCPSSNAATGAVPSLAEHPLPALVELGVPVVLASDDPPMFGTSLLEEYRRARDVLHLSTDALIDLAAAGIRAGFAAPSTKRRMLQT
jgi:aminodeoxyfutalosine deaminase